ncbi:MAG: HlyD family secretion protein [Bacteroidetes bacterium]|nr:HlyD family secretion protein [Bacteroidota bacterium]
MLNISDNTVNHRVDKNKYSSLDRVEKKVSGKVLIRLLIAALICSLLFSLLPWTQNVRSIGSVTTLRPDHRPQTINSIIDGRIKEWFVQEGDYVKKGDTLALLSEIKDEYFDENLLPRTENQLELKKQTAKTYSEKETAQSQQLTSLQEQQILNLQQAKIKLSQALLRVQNDSIAYRAAQLNYQTAKRQFNRMDSLYNLGLKSLVDLESRRIAQQQTKSSELEALNRWLNAQNEVKNLQLEITNVQTKFNNDYAKTLSEKLSTTTDRYDAESSVNKLENQYSNYSIRSGFYYITAPQDGYVASTFLTGTGETIKAGQALVSFMPTAYQLAVSLYIEPIDMPLMNIGQKVRVQFDGWPAIVFSGWPNVSYGTYGGTIYAIDQFISSNGKYRVLVKPDDKSYPWPKELRFGGGTKTMILLKNVPIWYELWRNINGFPPDYYQTQKNSKE